MIDVEKPVRVFKNWKRGCYNIMQGGIVRASARQVRLADVEFLVRASGRARMLREQRRNVHAYAVGRLVDWVHPDDARDLEPFAGRGALYDPYRFASFVDRETGAPVVRVPAAQLDEGGVTYAGGVDDVPPVTLEAA